MREKNQSIFTSPAKRRGFYHFHFSPFVFPPLPTAFLPFVRVPILCLFSRWLWRQSGCGGWGWGGAEEVSGGFLEVVYPRPTSGLSKRRLSGEPKGSRSVGPPTLKRSDSMPLCCLLALLSSSTAKQCAPLEKLSKQFFNRCTCLSQSITFHPNVYHFRI